MDFTRSVSFIFVRDMFRKARTLLKIRARKFAQLLPHDMSKTMLDRIGDGRTDLVFDYVSAGHAANSTDKGGVPLIKLCAYYGDVSAIKFLASKGESLKSLGDNFDLNEAVFHGHWRLCQFLIEQGADVNKPLPDTGETPLHAALCTADRLAHDLVIKVLLSNGANPNCATKPSVESGGFMRDCRTKAETPLHRAAAFGTEETIQMLLDAGAVIDAKDMNGDSPLTWASWHLRPDSILRKLCYGDFQIRPKRRSMAAYLLGEPHV
ncbi:MAG: ankyrin repeat domain-containing protein [Verrucomicrobiales bacterium]|nr:ankyrin repeat domain-containing protein [Verrucomicrobiales bacterium]